MDPEYRHDPWLLRLSLNTGVLAKYQDMDCDECAYVADVFRHGIPRAMRLLDQEEAWCRCCEDCRGSAHFKFLDPESITFRVYHRFDNNTVEVGMRCQIAVEVGLRSCQFKPRYPKRRKRVAPMTWHQKTKEFLSRPSETVQQAILNIAENRDAQAVLYDLVTAEMGIVRMIMEYFVPVAVRPSMFHL